ncbi:desulfoferrodoxin [Candidatus Pacearchaeota archaeon]|jgi:superoxide reductase|nr:desulfoferrodoxin [Candidatus Pacearchaeota archaeon]|tara:strand:+ start:6938 stop:7297 length:360 start_codon:yes stop_codon:yes gene_type:complete
MTEHRQIYKCEVCGNIIEVLHPAGGTLVCCNQNMKLLEENSSDAATEKHVPVIVENKVKVGSVEHPMEESHYIEWIEATDGKNISKVFLKPGEKPEAEFSFDITSARAYCNLHGLWKSE